MPSRIRGIGLEDFLPFDHKKTRLPNGTRLGRQGLLPNPTAIPGIKDRLRLPPVSLTPMEPVSYVNGC